MENTAVTNAGPLRGTHRRDNPKTTHLPEIEGLRGVAVLAVLFFHLGLSGFSGGFVGVDIFFTISGFLITRQISSELGRGEFSLVRFYERRARRLVPVLLVMLATTLAIGAVLFLPRDWAQMARNAASAGVFLSNIAYWMQVDYFDGDANIRALLHTWSLGVEEQFYLFFPPILLASTLFARKRMLGIIIVVATASFASSMWMMSVQPSAAFYLLPFRGWEFLLGALLALTLQQKILSDFLRNAGGLLGFLLVGISVITFDDMTPFPGAAALLPCGGTALMIVSGSESLSGKLLGSFPLTFVGKISYSLYLWHWPLIVFVNYQSIGRLTVVENLGLAAISVVIGYFSWRFVETPFRVPRPREPAQAFFLRYGIATAAVCSVASMIYFYQGIPQRFPKKAIVLASYAASINPEGDKCGEVDLQLAPNSTCTIGDAASARTFLWGDSHAGALFGALENMAKHGQSTIYGATPQCPPLKNGGTSSKCLDGNRKRLKFVLSHPEIETVIIAARWSLYLDGRLTGAGEAENNNNNVPNLISPTGEPVPLFGRQARTTFRDGLSTLVETLLANGKRVVLVYPIPETGYDIPSTLALMSARGDDPARFTTSRDAYLRRQSRALRILDGLGDHPRLVRVYPEEIFCPDARCITYAKGMPLYFDSHHLSIPGAQMLEAKLRHATERSNPLRSPV